MLACFEALGCRMSLKVHFLRTNLDYFAQNLGDMSEEHGKRFHQDIKNLETRYQGQWNAFVMATFPLSCARARPRSCFDPSAQ